MAGTEILKLLDLPLAIPTQLAGRMLGLLGSMFGRKDDRPLLIRPGGMGDLILLCIAMENWGIPLSEPLFLIEKRSKPWANHLGLAYLCYDEIDATGIMGLLGTFSTVVNTEQRFGLAQSFALAVRRLKGELICFETIRGAGWAARQASYDPYSTHEIQAFGRLLATAFLLEPRQPPLVRHRKMMPSGRAMIGIAGRQAPSRDFDLARWTAFARSWADGRNLAIATSEADFEFASELSLTLGSVPIVKGDFSEVCQAIATADELLTVDGGMVHIASYYGIPTTAIFTSGRDGKWAPIGAGSKVIRRSDLGCQPCTLFGQTPPCGAGFACKNVDLDKHQIQSRS